MLNKFRWFVALIQLLSETGKSSKVPWTKVIPGKNVSKLTN